MLLGALYLVGSVVTGAVGAVMGIAVGSWI